MNARWLLIAVLLAGTSAHAQETTALRTEQPAPLPGTDTALQAPLPDPVPIDAQNELTLEGGIVALNDGRYAQAAQVFEREIATQGESAMLYALLGRARLLAREYDAAQIALRRATQLEPNVAKYRLWFGHTSRASGDIPAARKAYRSALALEPTNAQAQAALRETEDEAVRPATADVRSYRVLLASTYILAPLIGGGLAEALRTPVPLGLVAVAPSLIHFAHGHLLPGVLAPFGVAAGILIPYGIAKATAGGCREGSCLPALIGGFILGYTVWAVFDVIAFGEVEAARDEPATRSSASPTIGFRLEPLPNGFRGGIGGQF